MVIQMQVTFITQSKHYNSFTQGGRNKNMFVVFVAADL